jgi:hypothetical protein
LTSLGGYVGSGALFHRRARFDVATLETVPKGRSAQLNDAHRKISVAAKPSAVRPACSAAHFSINARLTGPALAGSVAISILFVGMMPRSV